MVLGVMALSIMTLGIVELSIMGMKTSIKFLQFVGQALSLTLTGQRQLLF